MPDAFTALAAQDPATPPYHHPDPAHLASRIAAAPAPRASLSRRFRLAVAAAVATSGLVTVGLVAAITATPALPLLAFAPSPATTFAAAKTAAGSTLFTAPSPSRPVAGSFGPGDSLASAYQLMVAAPSLTATMNLGAALNVVGTIGGYNGTVFTETGQSGSRITYETTTGLARWRYQAGTTPGLSVGDFAAALDRQRWGYDVKIPTKSAASPVVVDGSSTTLSVRVTVRDGRVVAASGPAFVVAALTDYRLRSPNAALAALASVRPTTATSVELSWSTYTLADHLVWLLPTFVYHGRSGDRGWTGESLAVESATLTGTAG